MIRNDTFFVPIISNYKLDKFDGGPISKDINNTYNVSVRVKVGSQWGNYGTACTISTPSIPSTKVQAAFCGSTVASLSHYFYCDNVTGATDYEWEFVNTESNFPETVARGFVSNSMSFSFVNGEKLNTTYDVRVRAKVGNQWGSFNTICTISTPEIPSTKVRTLDCGITATSLSQFIYCDAVKGATDYEWKFENITGGFSFTRTRGSSNTAMNLSWIIGIQNAKTYDVSVRTKVNGSWGNYGTVCQITTPSVAKKLVFGNQSDETIYISLQSTNISLDVYPNPAKKNNAIAVNLSADTNLNGTIINIYNIIGQIVYSQNINFYATKYLMNIEMNNQFISGLFIIQAENKGVVQRLKLIVE